VPPAQQTVAASHGSPVLMQNPSPPPSASSEVESEPPSPAVLSALESPGPASDRTGFELDEQAMTKTASDIIPPVTGETSGAHHP